MKTAKKPTSPENGLTVDGTGAPIASVTLQRLPESATSIRIVGQAPLIPHKWSEKSLNEMRTKQFGSGVRPARTPKNPDEEAVASCYWVSDGNPGMPATAFKAAMVSACRFFDGLPMTLAKTLFFVEGSGIDQLVAIDGAPEMFEATPRNSNGGVDLRYRMKIFPWSAELRVKFLPTKIDPNSLAALVDAAGRVGVGDWRPGAPKSSTGMFGTFRVVE